MDTRRDPFEPALSALQLEGILALADDAIISIDASQRIVLFNQGAERTFGYTAAEVIGQPLEILLPERLRPAHRSHVSGFAGSPKSASRMGERGEIVGLRKDGTEFPAEASIVKLGTGEAMIFTAILRDVTERKERDEALRRAKEAAEAADYAKSMFLANMSHEIRTPLNAVIGMTNLLLDTALSEDQKECAETIRASGEALLTVINDILDYSKIEIGKLELERQPFDLRRCVEESLDLVTPGAGQKKLNLAYLIDDSVPAVLVSDVTRLRQVLVNLLGNAVKFTHAGEILVSIEGRGLPSRRHEVHFAVRDTGIGISPERMGQLFKSFSQLDTSTTRRYGGTGLGLAISKRLVEMMGGTIWAESQPGQGTTFHFTIEADQGGSSLARAYLQERSSPLTGKRILIVDDNTTNRRILVKQTLLWGMLPSAAAAGVEAMDLIRHGNAFDVAILDMSMPEMDGLELALEIRKYRDAEMLPLIMLTSMSQRPKMDLLERIGFSAFLNKPIKASQLFDVITDALGVREAKLPEPAPRPSYDATLGRRLPLSILVAEDNAINQRVILRLLERFGYRADAVANGTEVLEALDRQSYDLILMDVQMPEMDGLEATRRILQRFSGHARPRIVAMTANALAGDRDICLAAGMDGYIAKPVELKQLQAILESMASPSAEFVQPGRQKLEGHLDRSRIDTLRMMQDENNPRLVDNLIDMFRADAPASLAAIERAVTEGNPKQLEQLSHRFLSSLGNLGLIGMCALCVELGLIGRSGKVAGAERIVADLKKEYEYGLEALMAERNGEQPN